MRPMARPGFERVAPVVDFPRRGAHPRFWREADIFGKSLAMRRGGPRFVFYEGPPTANGMPHNGHVLTRVMKDVIPRYKAMRGFDVPRRPAGTRTGCRSRSRSRRSCASRAREAIDAYGVEPFVRRCLESVFRYTKEWEELTEKLGFWLDIDDAYVTYHQSYVESVWWALSQLFERGLLYRGTRSCGGGRRAAPCSRRPRSARATAPSTIPRVYVRLPLADEPGTSLLVWTTTPWTLPSNASRR